MRRKMLIAQVGRGTYLPTKYIELDRGASEAADCLLKREAPYETGYTFEAVLNEIQERCTAGPENMEKPEEKGVDTLVLIGTSTSYWGSLCVYYMNYELTGKAELVPVNEEYLEKLRVIPELKNVKQIRIADEETRRGTIIPLGYAIDGMEDEETRHAVEKYLTSVLGKKFSGLQVRIIILKKGVAENEMKNNFALLQAGLENIVDKDYNWLGEDIIKDGEERKIDIYFDISNGFRSLPMYIWSFTSYLTRIRPETYELFMYYGMADAVDSYGDVKITGADKVITEKYAPMVELDEVTDLMNWINAVNEFRSLGSVRELKRIFSEHSEWDIPVGNRHKKKLSELFMEFDYGTNVHNLKILEDTIAILCSLKELGNEQKNVPEENRLPRQAVILLESIGKDFEKRFNSGGVKYKYSNLTLRLAEWFHGQGRLGSAAIATMEGITTYLLERFSGIKGKKKLDIVKRYDMREKVKRVLMEEEGDESFTENYEVIRKEIRNIGAHILYENTDREEMERHGDTIRNMLELMFRDMRETDEERSIFASIKDWDEIRPFTKELQRTIENLKETDIPTERFSKALVKTLDECKTQIKVMEECENMADGGFELFLQELEEMKTLKALSDSRIRAEEGEPDREKYRKRFGESKKGSGSDRLLKYYARHYKDFIKIAEKLHGEKTVFINCSNHPSEKWSDGQKEAALKYGEITDIPFPPVSPSASEKEVDETAKELCRRIRAFRPAAVMCQGEYTLTYAVISKLRRAGIRVVAACTERQVVEEVIDGRTEKKSVFKFMGFREFD